MEWIVMRVQCQLVVSLCFCWLGCFSPTVAGEPQQTTYRIIPSQVGDWDVMWGELRSLPAICIPTTNVGGLPEALEVLKKEGRPVNVSDLKPNIICQTIPLPNGKKSNVQVIYTDEKLIKSEKVFITLPPLDYLKWALPDTSTDGIIFNPKSSFCDEEVFSYAIDKVLTARLIGYLMAEPVEKGNYHVRANEARQANQPYQCCHYASRSFELKEPWEKAELAKLWAWHTLDFPTAQGLVKHELKWFLKKYGSTPEGQELLAAVEKKKEPPAR